MKKLLSLFVFLVAIVPQPVLAGGFGLFRRCAPVKKIAVPVAAVTPPQTIVINNPPAAPVIVQGGSAYGYSQPGQSQGFQQISAQYAALDPAAFLNQAARLVQNGQDVAKLGFSQYATVGDNQLKNQTAIAALIAAREGPNVAALQQALRSTETPTPSSIRLELNTEGRWEIRPGNGSGATTEPVTANGDFPLITQNCASCHSGAAPKGGITIDGTAKFNADQFKLIRDQVFSGKMPKAAEGAQPAQLSPEVRKAIVGEAALLLNGT